MVSTRGVKFKFSEGERVLCYEPDPTKAKVLYESKVLEVAITKDKQGCKLPEYLIHFNGWNSSWDRFVSEKLVLKDNDENRALQAKLAEAAGIHLKSKKKKLTVPEILKDANKKLKSDSEDNDTQGGTVDSDSSTSCSSVSSESSEDEDDEEAPPITLEIPDVLKKKLEDDYLMINKWNKHVRLPCEPNVVSILESYVIQYAKTQMKSLTEKNKGRTKQAPIEKSINFCKEIADALRIYFDFTLPVILLYNKERAQYENLVNNHKPTIRRDGLKDGSQTPLATKSRQSPHRGILNRAEKKRAHNLDNGISVTYRSDASSNSKVLRVPQSATTMDHQEVEIIANDVPRRILRSNAVRCEAAAVRRLTAQKNIDRDPVNKSQAEDKKFLDAERRLHETCFIKLTRSSCHINDMAIGSQRQKNRQSPPSSTASSLPVATSKSVASSMSQRIPLQPSRLVANNTSSISPPSSQSGCSTPTQAGHNDVPVGRALWSDILTWRLLPPEACESSQLLPSLAYGAPHLLRLFIKLPELLEYSNISKRRLGALIKCLEAFLECLAMQHDQLFSLSAYTDSTSVPDEGCDIGHR